MLKRAIEGVAQGIAYLRESSSDTVLNLKPRVQLDGHSCGLQSLASILDYYDFEVELDELGDDIGLTTDGCDEDQVRKAIRAYGLRHRTISAMSLRRLRECIDDDHPVLVPINKDNHWAVVYGYGEESIYVMDSSIGRALKYAGKWSEEMFLGRWGRYGIEVFEPERKRVRVKAPTPKRAKRKTG